MVIYLIMHVFCPHIFHTSHPHTLLDTCMPRCPFHMSLHFCSQHFYNYLFEKLLQAYPISFECQNLNSINYQSWITILTSACFHVYLQFFSSLPPIQSAYLSHLYSNWAHLLPSKHGNWVESQSISTVICISCYYGISICVALCDDFDMLNVMAETFMETCTLKFTLAIFASFHVWVKLATMVAYTLLCAGCDLNIKTWQSVLMWIQIDVLMCTYKRITILKTFIGV